VHSSLFNCTSFQSVCVEPDTLDHRESVGDNDDLICEHGQHEEKTEPRQTQSKCGGWCCGTDLGGLGWTVQLCSVEGCQEHWGVKLSYHTVARKKYKSFLVKVTDAVVDPRTVVIHIDNAPPAGGTVIYIGRLHRIALVALSFKHAVDCSVPRDIYRHVQRFPHLLLHHLVEVLLFILAHRLIYYRLDSGRVLIIILL